MKRLAFASLLLLALGTSSGCCVLQEFWYALPCCHRCGPCGSPCGGGCCGGGCGGCSGGCGEVYYGEVSDPPACPDPCDCNGNWHGYPGYLPGGGYQGYYGPMGPRQMGQPTPAPVRSAPAAAPPAPTTSGRNGPPSDDEMGLPPGAKIIHRSDRVLSESTQKPVQRVSANMNRRRARTVRPISQRQQYVRRDYEPQG